MPVRRVKMSLEQLTSLGLAVDVKFPEEDCSDWQFLGDKNYTPEKCKILKDNLSWDMSILSDGSHYILDSGDSGILIGLLDKYKVDHIVLVESYYLLTRTPSKDELVTLGEFNEWEDLISYAKANHYDDSGLLTVTLFNGEAVSGGSLNIG